MGYSKNSSKGKFIAIQSYLRNKKTLTRQPKFTPKTTGKRRRTTTKTNKNKISRRKEIIRSEQKYMKKK